MLMATEASGTPSIERRGVGIPVEVDRMLFEQIGTHDHADVGEGEEELVIFIDRHQRRGNVAVHDAHIHICRGST